MNLKEACEKLNADYEGTLNRFGGMEMMYVKFLKRFLEDNTYTELEKAWQEKNYPEIEKTAHTLKGVAGNLGLTNLFTVSNSLVQEVREQNYSQMPETYEKIVREYNITVDVIKNID